MDMNPTAHFFSSSHNSPGEIPFLSNSILFHGLPLDERGESAIALTKEQEPERVLIVYDSENMTLSANGKLGTADESVELIRPHIKDGAILLEATTLGFGELFCIIQALITLRISRFQVLYVEPAEYTQPNGGDSFALSELINGYRPIPHSVLDLSSGEVEAGVFFLGYESERLARALEEYQMISTKEIKVIFGVPAYQAGWELNSIVPHLQILSEQQKFELAYCAANDPGSAFDCLESTRKSLSPNHKMFVAPIGTKPCGVASAVFASLFPKQVGLIYDHPKK